MNRIILIIFFSLVNIYISAQTTIILSHVPTYTINDAQIFIAGNFNSWNPGDSNYKLHKNANEKYQIKLNLVQGTKIEFKFTQGTWATVEKGANFEEISNRKYTIGNNDTLYLTIENWSNSSSNSTASDNVQILADSFYIPQLERYRTIRIFLPADYQTSQKKYPVIYMHDGQNLFDDATSFSGEWKVDESLNSLFSEGFPPVIVVGIDNGGTERINELTPWTNPEYGGGDGDKYVKFIIETLKPYIDSHFRTLSNRENTSIWGSSLGGLISLYAVLEYPEIFGKAGVFSPSLWFNDSIYKLAANSDISFKNKIYILAGGNEGDGSVIQDCQKLIDSLKKNNYCIDSVKFKSVPSGTHSESFWSTEFPDAFKWLFSKQSYINKSGLLWIFPNPIKNNMNIYSNLKDQKIYFQIINSNGNIFISDSFINNLSIDISELPTGIYFINSYTSQQIIKNQKIVKL